MKDWINRQRTYWRTSQGQMTVVYGPSSGRVAPGPFAWACLELACKDATDEGWGSAETMEGARELAEGHSWTTHPGRNVKVIATSLDGLIGQGGGDDA